MKLSILTTTIPERIFSDGTGNEYSYNSVHGLSNKIADQIGNLPVEHLILCDNRARSIGAKRQALADIAMGDYIAFVDDDDEISGDYVSSLLDAIETGADVITFRQMATVNGSTSEIIFGIRNHDQQFNPSGITYRAPWHVCAWKRRLVAGCLFAESNYGEDLAWCLQARRRVKTGHHIDRVLHHYRHSAETTAAPAPL